MLFLFPATIGSWMSLVVGASVLAFFELYYFVAALAMEIVLKKSVVNKTKTKTQKDLPQKEQNNSQKNERKN